MASLTRRAGKVRRAITLDPDVVDALGADEAAFSTIVNQVLRAEVERRQRAAALDRLLDRLAVERRPVEESEVDAFRELLR